VSEDRGVIDRPPPRGQRVEALIAAFRRQFRRDPEGIAEAPGRVNLIGEHVDYNDGLVLPSAIDRSVMCAWARGSTRATTFQSLDERGNVACLPPPKELPPRHFAWFDYGVGVVAQLAGAGHAPFGADLLLSGDVPQGAGLSSSAALEVAVAGALRDAFSLDISDVDLALLCQRAENEYAGVQCGIMDQFAATLSSAGHALLIDCRTLAYEQAPLRLEQAGLAVVIANSAVKRALAQSAYNERRRECAEAVATLRERLGRPELASLRDVTTAELDGLAIDSVPMRRARHVVTEIARVAAAAEALQRDDFAALGELMRESHLSLRDDFAVSSAELDLLAGLASAQEYVVGARLTGAGFGGCTVNLVRADAVEAFARDVIAPYRERTGLRAVMYVTSPQDGLRTWRP
jgi:galactokinase